MLPSPERATSRFQPIPYLLGDRLHRSNVGCWGRPAGLTGDVEGVNVQAYWAKSGKTPALSLLYLYLDLSRHLSRISGGQNPSRLVPSDPRCTTLGRNGDRPPSFAQVHPGRSKGHEPARDQQRMMANRGERSPHRVRNSAASQRRYRLRSPPVPNGRGGREGSRLILMNPNHPQFPGSSSRPTWKAGDFVGLTRGLRQSVRLSIPPDFDSWKLTLTRG